MAKIPDHKPIKDLFESLLGRDVTIATQSEKVVPTARRACCVGTYMDHDGETQALVAADLELSARAGAALGLVPSTGADSAIENKELPAALYDNFYEVLNIFSSLFFDDETGANLKLKTVYQPGMILPGRRPCRCAAWVGGRTSPSTSTGTARGPWASSSPSDRRAPGRPVSALGANWLVRGTFGYPRRWRIRIVA
ncbi:hypothetical protein [Mobilicoccus caccae]|uniref:Uncharacterized protein n=1 Tax=Mobilicoccus caccae TaxID=1859295 RepID=A0ABQ6IJZ4_9MICO|nr:hypothetical protein [Mobilicoccus caccae]GMA38247.1 hypothetical protein GCM10025883_02920 [Mobilicoccus caccae]